MDRAVTELPEVEQRVTLELAPLGRLAAHVSQLGDDHALLDLFVPQSTSLKVTEPCSAVLEWVATGGVRQLAGTVTTRSTGENLLLFKPTGRAGITQRRGSVRHEAILPVYVRADTGAPPAFHTFTVNISGRGLLIAGPEELNTGETVFVRLDLPGGLPVEATARVARHADFGLNGIEFLEIDDFGRERIERFVFERQRLEHTFLPPT
jgi:hypothetical protein